MEKHLHIVSFDVPFPADYGGVIDVYYKIAALHKAGVRIHLHCFTYGRKPAEELEKYCESVNYYSRRSFFISNLSTLPYIVNSRISEKLVLNLMMDDFPVLCEGLHTCGLLLDKRISSERIIYRESNIEHEYYLNLFRSERNILKKLFFLIESWRLRSFEANIRKVKLALVVSLDDTNYLKKKYPQLHSEYLPSFHPYSAIHFNPDREKFVLFHGNLGVPENAEAVELVLNNVVKNSRHKFVFAGKGPSARLRSLISGYSNVELVINPSGEKMNSLIRSAQVNLLYTAKAAGLKLKLLYALYNGGFVLVNPAMTAGTGLQSLCETARDFSSMKQILDELMEKKFNESECHEREKVLDLNYSVEVNAEKMIGLIYN